jgi:AcrR family transcriptional regulator
VNSEAREVVPLADDAIPGRGPQAGRRDAVRNYYRILDAARAVLGESGADASMEEIAARAGVGVGTVYRRFANKDALIDELVQIVVAESLAAAREALAAPGGEGLEQLLRRLGRQLACHARYAHLLLQRPDNAASMEIAAALAELTRRAVAAGTVHRAVAVADVLALLYGMRGLVQAAPDTAPESWERFLDIHLAGLRSPAPHHVRPAAPAPAAPVTRHPHTSLP